MNTLTKFLLGILAIALAASTTCHAQSGLMETQFVNFYGTNGSGLQGELIQGSDGLLYGASGQGGDFNQGTIFKITLDGSLTTLASFNGTNGEIARMPLLQSSDGSLYGFAFLGGNGFDGTTYTGMGTIFKFSNGALSTLYSFSGTNGNGPASLIFGVDGNLYGTTIYGGAFTNTSYQGDGTAFETTTNGAFTLLTSFDGTNGSFPFAMIQASDEDLYGVTESGGAYGFGTVFQMTSNGDVTTLFSFNGTNGSAPFTLIQGSDGALYGTTACGGNGFSGTPGSGDGTVFRITTNGGFTTLGLLNAATTGSRPEGRLFEVSNGVFYGTAVAGGPGTAPDGTLFQVTTNGGLTLLVSFIPSFELPSSTGGGVIKATDGNYYGVAGDTTEGVYAIRPIQQPVLHSCIQSNQINLSWNAWAGYSYSLICLTNLPNGYFADGFFPFSDVIAQTNGVMSFSDTIVDPQRFYQLVFSQVY